MNHTPSVLILTIRPQKQTTHTQQKVISQTCRNDRNDLSKAKRLHEPSLDKSNHTYIQTKWATSPTSAKMKKGRERLSARRSLICGNCGTRRVFPIATWTSWPRSLIEKTTLWKSSKTLNTNSQKSQSKPPLFKKWWAPSSHEKSASPKFNSWWPNSNMNSFLSRNLTNFSKKGWIT